MSLLVFLIISGWLIYHFRERLFGDKDEEQLILSNEFQNIKKIEEALIKGANTKENPAHDLCWLPKGKFVSVGGFNISHGMIYFGEQNDDDIPWNSEPSLINPKLSVEKPGPGYLIDKLSYWPSYKTLTALERGIYLDWLSRGASAPHIPVGFVFIFFYGLERRAFFDTKHSEQALNDIKDINAEIRRLLQIYGHNNSFKNYAGNFLKALDIRFGSGPSYYLLKEQDFHGNGLLLHAALAQVANEQIPIPSSLALAWILTQPQKTAATRCTEEFKALFKIYYEENFNLGLRLNTTQQKFSLKYQAASIFLKDKIDLAPPNWSELSAQGRPLLRLKGIADKCAEELDAYSRYLGRKSADKDSIEALALLPKKLIEQEFSSIKTVKRYIFNHFNGDDVQMDLSPFLKNMPFQKEDIFDRKFATSLSKLLFNLGIGIEPDPRFGGPLIKKGKMVMFKLLPHSEENLSSDYASMCVLLDIICLVASIDGDISLAEEQVIEQKLETWQSLDKSERVRLKAHKTWLLSEKRNFDGMKQKLSKLENTQKEAIAKLLVDIALADGKICPQEIKALIKIYELMGLSEKEFYAYTNLTATTPVSVAEADLGATSYAIPRSPSSIKVLTNLDLNIVKAKMAETQKVSTILASIFNEQYSEGIKPLPRLQSIAGLDEEYSDFVKALATQSSWSRDELLTQAKARKLMLDGAVDAINDAFFEKYQRPLMEGFDPVLLNSELIKEVRV